MRADLGAFFDHDDRHVAALFCGALLETDRGREPGRTRADDHHVEVHCLAGG